MNSTVQGNEILFFEKMLFWTENVDERHDESEEQREIRNLEQTDPEL